MEAHWELCTICFFFFFTYKSITVLTIMSLKKNQGTDNIQKQDWVEIGSGSMGSLLR